MEGIKYIWHGRRAIIVANCPFLIKTNNGEQYSELNNITDAICGGLEQVTQCSGASAALGCVECMNAKTQDPLKAEEEALYLFYFFYF